MKWLLLTSALAQGTFALLMMIRGLRRGPRSMGWATVYFGIAAGVTALTPPEEALAVLVFALGPAGLALGILLLRLEGQRANEHRRAEALHLELARYSHEATSQIEASQQRFHQLVRVAPVGVFEADTRGEVIYVSRRFSDLFEGTAPSLRGQGWFDTIHPGDREEVRASWARALEARSGFEAEFRLNRSKPTDSGAETPIWILCKASTPVLGTGEPGGIVGFVTEVTDRYVAEEERRALEVRMRRAQKMESLGVLAGGIAHDFNNLLVGILGNAEILRTRLGDPEPVAVWIDRIETAAMRAADLARQMLAYSGRGAETVEIVSLTEVVEEMVQLLEAGTGHTTTRLTVIPRELSMVHADSTQLRQVVMNLVINAAESYGETSGVVEISTGLQVVDREYLDAAIVDDDLPVGEYVYLEVKDQGEGMDPAALERVFDPFYSTKFTGRGLGLSVVLGIVRGHHGAIHVQTEPGTGTSIRVLLPCAEQHEAGEGSHRLERVSVWRSDATVLLVGAEDPAVEVTSTQLRDRGLAVLRAEGLDEALEICRVSGSSLQAILIDQARPGSEADGMLKRLQEVCPHLPGILLTPMHGDPARSSEPPSKTRIFVEKPFRSATLADAVRRALG